MIQVLQNWGEVGEATLSLQRRGLPTHETAQKNWDQFLLCDLLGDFGRDAAVLDLGCGAGHTLKLLHKLGFTNVHGLDLQIGWMLRLKWLREAWRSRRRPYHLHRGDITRLPFAAAAFDLAVCISTIEHGVALAPFLHETARVLKPGGVFFLTTDYWEQKLPTDSAAQVFGLPWQVFSREEIEELIGTARQAGLVPAGEAQIPACAEQTVYWNRHSYTFLALTFRKVADQRNGTTEQGT